MNTSRTVTLDSEAEARKKRAASTEHLQNPFMRFAIRLALGTSLHPVVNGMSLDDLKKLEKAANALPEMINDQLDDWELPNIAPGESV